jgi:Tfp pilus assembly protein PilF
MRPLVTLTLTAATVLLGSPAFAWSALQYDTQKDASSVSGKSVYDEIMERLDKQAEGQAAEQPTPEAKPAEASASPISDDKTQDTAAGSEKKDNETATAPASKSDSDSTANSGESKKDNSELVELTPATKKRPGKMPTEGINDPAFFYRRSLTFMEQGDFQSALNYIDKSLSLSPEYWEAWYQKALIYQMAGYDGPAARRYLALLQHRPEMVPAHIALGMLYRKHGNLELADNEYRTAIDLKPRCFAAHYNLANLLVDEQQPEKALKEYQNCLKIKPDDAQVHNNIGVLYEQGKYFEEADKEFSKATHLAPANAKFAANLDRLRKMQVSERAGQGTTKRMPL